MAIVFNKLTKIITVESPDTEVTIQNLLNAIRDYEDELTTLDIKKIASAAGKEDLGGGVSVGITMTLLDDWQLAFEARAGPTYIQCKVSGGNIVATNVSGAISPTAFTQVLVTASSSATQSDLSAIQYSSFGGGVSIDTVSGTAGTAYPIGTIESPVNNSTDAITIANSRGFEKLFVIGDLTLTTGDNVTGIEIHGQSPIKSTLTVDPAAVVTDCEFHTCTVTGTLDSNVSMYTCIIENLSYFEGYIMNCIIKGTLTLGGSSTTYLMNCSDGTPGPINMTIDMGGSGRDLMATDHSGGITIKNLTGANKVVLNIDVGRIEIDSTVTAGEVWCRGIGTLLDNSGAGATIYDGVLSQECIADSVWDETASEHLNVGSTGKALDDAGAAGNPWSSNMSSNNVSGTFGEGMNKIKKITGWLRSLL